MKLRLLIFINLICIGLGIGLGPFLAAFQFDPNASQAKWNVYFYIVMSSASSLLLNPFGLFLALYCERLEAKLRKRMSFVFFLINLLLALFWGLTEFVRFPPAENTTYPHHSTMCMG